MNRSTVHMTFGGMAALVASNFSLPLALYLRSGPLLVLGVLGLLMTGGARYLAQRQLRGIVIRRKLPKRVFPGEWFDIEIEVISGSSVPRDAELIDRLAGRSGGALLLEMADASGLASFRYRGKVNRRGRIRHDHYELVSSWPFGFFCATQPGRFQPARPGDDCLLAVPKPVIPPCLDRILDEIERESALFSAQIPEDLSDFRSLREYRSGDAVHAIQWAASTRAGRLMVRESDPPLPRPSLHGIFLHQYLPAGQLYQPDRFEKMLQVASGLILRCQLRGLPLVLRIESPGRRHCWRLPREKGYGEVLDFLAEWMGTPLPSCDGLREGWEIFAECDQVFVLGDFDHRSWQSFVEGRHPSVVCLDPASGQRSRTILLSRKSLKGGSSR